MTDLEYVRTQIGDKDHIKLVERLIDVSHVVLLYGCMLCSRRCQFRERSQECFYPAPLHFSELDNDGLALPRSALLREQAAYTVLPDATTLASLLEYILKLPGRPRGKVSAV